MDGPWELATSTPENKYNYNGKELQDDFGLDWFDYHARFYDPAIARWGQVDPHSENYYSYSPYNYVVNNPLIYIDPDGKDLTLTLKGTNEEKWNALFGFAGLLIHGTEGKVNVNLKGQEDGTFKAEFDASGSDVDQLSESGKAFYNEINTVIESDFDTKLNLYNNTSSIGVADWQGKAIDVADIMAFPDQLGIGNNKTGTKAGKLTHEIVEQYHLQKNGIKSRKGFLEIHRNFANKAESRVDGLDRTGQGDIQDSHKNVVGKWTDYYNKVTGKTHRERAIFKGYGGAYLPTIILRPVKEK